MTAKKIQLQELIISWLFFAIETFLKFLLSIFAIFLFLGDSIIFLKDIFDLHTPVTTDDVILPVPIKPNFIIEEQYTKQALLTNYKNYQPPKNNLPTSGFLRSSSPDPAIAVCPDTKTYPMSANSRPFLAFCSTSIIVFFSFS